MRKLAFLLLCMIPISNNLAQVDNEWNNSFDDDLSNGNDIFTDFQEDLGTKQMQEDERFYRYGRFVSTTIGLGITSFTGNRGKAYHDNLPTFSLGLIYFSDFQNAFNMGIEYSKHTMYVDSPSVGTNNESYGAIDITFIRPFLAYRYYVDTTDLGSLLTYANPYLIGRLEYWYQTRKFRDYDYDTSTSKKGGGLGAGLGFGIEIPMDLNKSFIGLQFLVHQVTLPDTDSGEFEPDPTCTGDTCYGYSDLKGMGYSIITSYIFSW